jgi:Tim44-like domain
LYNSIYCFLMLGAWGDLHWSIKLAITVAVVVGSLLVILWFIKQLVVGIIRNSTVGIVDRIVSIVFRRAKDEIVSAAHQMPQPNITITQSQPARTRIPPKKQRVDHMRQLKRADKNFSEAQFKDLASTVFVILRECVERKDLGQARPYVSSSSFRRFISEIDELKNKNWTRHIDKLKIEKVDIINVVHDGPYFYIAVKIDSSAIDYTVSDKDKNLISGKKQKRSFSEKWTFMRSDKVMTPKESAEVMSKKCPNCGAAIEVNALGKCRYCESELTSGNFSWVLSEIVLAND